MSQPIYSDSNYRFTDPIRFFKANDPYYFEVDNIPLKQLQENCLWLKDQFRKLEPKITSIKRSDIDELRPYATGGDRVVRVKPGRYTARINDASKRIPLAYIEKIAGGAIGDVDAWSTALPNPGTFANNKNYVLQTVLDTFKTYVSQNAVGMNGLAERAFTWPVVNTETPVDNNGADLASSSGTYAYGGFSVNSPGGGASIVPFVITQALLWAKSNNNQFETILPTYEINNLANGFVKLPRTENYFIKVWRGVARLAIVDVEDEISIEVPQFNAADFSYINETGQETTVAGVKQRIDLVFIYSKPVDVSGVNILDSTGRKTITKPTLGIVRGAGIKTKFNPTALPGENYLVDADDSILAHPSDQANTSMGFTSTSSNDIAYDIRGSFPAPDDLLNIAPLISEKLEDTAYELVGQSIMPVAYVFVDGTSQTLLSTDVIDIRPFFRTAELSYNERAGIAGAFPQLSLANPAVGKAQMDYEIKRSYDDLKSRIDLAAQVNQNTSVLATGYVFGGWNFGPEGALYDFYKKQFAGDSISNDNQAYIKNYVVNKYGIGSTGKQIEVPAYPDWDLATWCVLNDISDKGYYPNDYINSFISEGTNIAYNTDRSIVAGSYRTGVSPDGTILTLGVNGGSGERSVSFANVQAPSNAFSKVNFNYISKRIRFNRPSWLADYSVDVGLVNCLSETFRGGQESAGSYTGIWVEKGFNEFVIYVAFVGPDNNPTGGLTQAGISLNVPGNPAPRIPAPHPLRYYVGVPGNNNNYWNTATISERGGDRFSSFIVPVLDVLGSNTSLINFDTISNAGFHIGNPRVAKCTYPTVMWKLTGVPNSEAQYIHANLNSANPVISLRDS